MSIVDRARAWLGRGMVKALNLNIISPWLTAAFMEPTFKALCTEGYKANGAVFACASTLAFAFPEPRLVVYRQTATGREAQPTHPLTQLMSRPNPVMGIGEFLQFHIIYECIGGNCYWYKVRDKASRIISLWPLHDGQVTPIYSPTNLIDHYELDNGTDTPDEIPITDIVHHRWLPDPLNPARGLSPLVAVAREVDTDNEATRYCFTLLKNDAVPRLALKVPREVVLDSDMRARLREDWQQKQGGENRGKVAVLEGGLDVTKIGLNLQELAFEAFRRVPEARIAGAMRVPPIVAGLNVGLEQGTYSNYEESVRSFTTRTLVPLWRKVATQATASLVSDYGDDTLSVDFDMGTVMALAEAMTAKRQFVDSAVRGGYLTRNEARDELGKPRVVGGDVFLVSAATVTEPAALETQSAGKAAKGLRAIQDKATREAAGIRSGRERQRIRREIEGRMVTSVVKYFDKLSRTVVARARGKAADAPLTMTGAITVTHTGATEDKRLPTIDQLLLGQDYNELGVLLKQFYAAIIEASWETISAELGITVAFDLTDPAVTAVLSGAGGRVTQITQTTRDAIVQLIQYGNEQGWSIYDLVRGDDEHPGLADIAGGLSYIGPNGQPITLSPAQRARMIARTELGWAQNQATTERYKANGVTSVGVLDDGAADDDEPCVTANGQTWTLAQAEENPLEHPNCIVGDVEVLAPNVLAGYAREFHGEVVILRTAANHNLTCTAQHPILTGHGWVAAGELREGDEIVCTRNSERIARLFDPDNDDVPTAVEQVVDTLLKARGMTTRIVPGAAEDFHGDGVANSQVNVVFANGLLECHIQAIEHTGKLVLSGGRKLVGPLLFGQSALDKLGLRTHHAPHGGMGGGSVGAPLLGSALVGGEGLRFASAAESMSYPIEATAQSRAADSNFGSQRLGTLASHIAGAEAIKIESAREFVAGPIETAVQAMLGNAQLSGEGLNALASEVALVQVVEIRRSAFSGHVYNLSTSQGWYIANGIITHNCTRCFFAVFD